MLKCRRRYLNGAYYFYVLMQINLSPAAARKMSLAAGALTNTGFAKGVQGTLQAIEHLGYIQIDTISVVERAHHHILHTRLPDYKPAYLHQLLEKDKTVFEYWSHAAAFLPMKDYRFSLHRKHNFSSGHWKWYTNRKMCNLVYDRIKAEGPLQSRDFEEQKKTSGWWNWKEAKLALEQCFMEGRLMVAARKNFQKVYDLTERVLPAGVNDRTPTNYEFVQYLVTNAIRTYGFVNDEEVAYLRKGMKSTAAGTLKKMAADGLIIPVQIKGSNKQYYATEEGLRMLDTKTGSKKVYILSPFDNSIIQRKRIKNHFGFDYTIECYVPEKKRQYGYFCLPLLYGDTFIGRADCKADRSSGQLLVKLLHFEKEIKLNEALLNALHKSLQRFTKFNGCNELVIVKSNRKLPW